MRDIQNERGRTTALVLGPRGQLVLALLAILFSSSLARAAKYGDIEVTIKSEPRGTAVHGYAEVEFVVTNRSSQAAHDVRITYPKSSYSYGGDYLRAVSRNVSVGAGESARVVIAYPERIDLRGNGAGVTIDGREEDSALPVGTSTGSRGHSSYGSARSWGTQLLALYSKSVDTRFSDWTAQTQAQLQSAGKYLTAETVRADQAVDQWSTNWLGYTRYDGVVVTADDLRRMPAEVRSAIGQYVECGGALFVLGRDPQLPGPWKLKPDPQHPVSVAAPGFGQCITTDQTDIATFPARVLTPVLESWSSTAAPWLRTRTPSDANRTFPVVEDIGVPVKGLLALMFVFAIAIGPVNLIILIRKKRKLWLFWTVPLISFVTCLTVFAYMALTEGWQGRSRIEGFTVLDENSRRASTLGWTGFYTPLLPSGGLRFSAETEVSYQNGEDPYSSSYSRRGSSNSALTIDWTREQHLASGWLTPRVPAHFALRKSELRRERMTISKGADGAPEAVNGLGADLSQFWYRDEGGNVFFAEGIPGGGRAALKPLPGAPATAGAKTLRSIYAGDWSTLPDRMKSDGPALLAPRTYLGVMEAAPFVDDGMPGASVRKTRSVVYGILKEGGDGS
ncbi:hypothetical protein J8F10_05320 [Gemmata sp. G18]|uniref:DUF4350 domain-containing protein n=1 Tax=Gemmata palustris TaxID=2822762 RepID=A0ABS5BPB4_9BACT|nr:hypothetical protein [Gemmata palustris]MBP3954703.1 hypothetical protein [Gemmata palustris]